MKIAVISDLHLAPAPINRCTASEAELLGLFDELEARADRVVVAGDLFDLDRPRVPGDWRGQLEAIRAEFSPIYARLKAYDWLIGNHDAGLRRLGVPRERYFIGPKARALICHGHRWDMGLKKVPGLAASANFAAGWLGRAGWGEGARQLGRVPLALDERWQQASGRALGPDRGLRGGRELVKEGPWDIVVCGHTHLLRLDVGGGGVFVNSGSICQGYIDWALVDLGGAANSSRRPSVELWRDGARFARAEKRAEGWRACAKIA